MKDQLDELRRRLLEVNDLQSASALLRWDQATYMPPGGAPARGRQLATLTRLAHEKFTDPALGVLLDRLERSADRQPYDSDDASLLRATRREYDQAARVPAEFVAELNRHAVETFHAWTEARPANDFARVRPLLEKTLELSRRYAGFFPGAESVADPLIDLSDYGMKASAIRAIFSALRARLVPLVRAIGDQPLADASCLAKHVSAD